MVLGKYANIETDNSIKIQVKLAPFILLILWSLVQCNVSCTLGTPPMILKKTCMLVVLELFDTFYDLFILSYWTNRFLCLTLSYFRTDSSESSIVRLRCTWFPNSGIGRCCWRHSQGRKYTCCQSGQKEKKVSVGLAFSWAQVWPRAEKTKLLQKYASFSSRPRMKKFLKLIARSEKKMIGEHEKVLHAYLVS